MAEVSRVIVTERLSAGLLTIYPGGEGREAITILHRPRTRSVHAAGNLSQLNVMGMISGRPPAFMECPPAFMEAHAATSAKAAPHSSCPGEDAPSKAGGDRAPGRMPGGARISAVGDTPCDDEGYYNEGAYVRTLSL